MKKMPKYAFLLCSMWWLFFIRGMAQDVEFTASAPAVVSAGETFEISFTLNARPDQFRQPDFSPFTLLGGPSTSSSSSIQMIGSQIKQTITITYSYYLQGNTPGKYTIPSAQAVIKGKTYQSNPVSIEVVKGTTAPSTAAPQGQAAENQQVNEIQPGKDLYAAFIINKKNVYLGEPVIVTLKIYDRLGLVRLEPPKLPSMAGFYKNDIPTPPLRQLTRENVGGQIYNTGVIARFILYPQKTGNLTIGSVEFNGAIQKTVARRSRSWFDFDFDFPTIQEQPVTFRTEPVTINVKDLPPGKPVDFSGTVGDLNMSATLDKPLLNSNEALTLKIKLSGKGNMKMIPAPVVSFPADFDAYSPKLNVQEEYTTEGTSGSVTFEYIAIPRHAGNYTIPPVSFSYFSLKDNSYKTLTSPSFSVTVNKGREDTILTVVSGLAREDVRLLGKDIRYIKVGIPKWKSRSFWLDNPLFFLWYVVPLLIFLAVVYIRRRTIKERADAARMRNRRANATARKSLKLASQALSKGNSEKFYEEVSKALWGYLSNKLNIPLADLSREKAWEMLVSRGVPEDLTRKLVELLDTCEFARFAPEGSLPPMKNVYSNAAELIGKLEDNLR